MMNQIQRTMLEKIAGLHEVPMGAHNIRVNSELSTRKSTENIVITSKKDVSGIDVVIKDNTKNESVHIPVLLSQTGLTEMVYNDFEIGENCDITIIAGCGIHNAGSETSQHDGIHTFNIGRNSHIRYIENHYGSGEGTGERVMNPQTVIHAAENAIMEMETIQIEGVSSTIRETKADLAANAKLYIVERLMTHDLQKAKSEFDINLHGENSGTTVSSRSVAKDKSYQSFASRIVGNAACQGHSECDAIIMGSAVVDAIPEILANHPDATLIHEAAIGKIAGEQIIKLKTLGLTEEEAEEQIVSGFLA